MSSNIPIIPDYLEDTDYEVILANYLGNVRNDVDKREGSIIWDAGSPCCIEIARAHVYLYSMILNVFASTAEAPFMDYRAGEVGLERNKATYAKRLGVFKGADDVPFALEMGASFSTIDETSLVNFTVESVYTLNNVTIEGSYILKCETIGVIGNQYFGTIVPVQNINGLATATLSDVLIPGEDEEGTETLRQAYFKRVKTKSFNGNVPAYKELIGNIPGVSGCQVYPAVLGDMTIKLSILDSSYNKPSAVLVNEVQTMMDPYHDNADYAGQGLGLAPIDHKVVIVSCTEVAVNISAKLELVSGMTLASIQTNIINNLENYFLEVRKNWATGDDLNSYKCNIFWAKVQSTILNTQGVENVSNLTLNGEALDIILTENKTTQQLPMKGTVTLV